MCIPNQKKGLLVCWDRFAYGENIGFVSLRGSAESIADQMHNGGSIARLTFVIGQDFDEVGIAAVQGSDGWYLMQFYMG